MEAATQLQTDREQIVAHIHGLFAAFIRGDREAIRRGHTRDWTGFQVRSDGIVRGIDAYMGAAEQALRTFRGTRYEIRDIDVQVHGSLAVVYYRADYWIRDDSGEEKLLPLRSVDVYRREAGGWNQAGSNICLAPVAAGDNPPPSHGGASPAEADDARPRPLSSAEKSSLLADREAVWRAWFAHDEAALARLLPADVVAINADREPWMMGRSAVLQRARQFAAGGAKLLRLDFPRTEIQACGGVAILYTTYEFELEGDGRRQTFAGRGTEVFIRAGGRWLNSGWHLDSGM
jgi:ketosteroid isomerase-like protein